MLEHDNLEIRTITDAFSEGPNLNVVTLK